LNDLEFAQSYLLDQRVNAKTGRRQKNNLFQRKLIMGVITRTKRARQAKNCQIFHLEYFGDGDIDDENKISSSNKIQKIEQIQTHQKLLNKNKRGFDDFAFIEFLEFCYQDNTKM